MADEFAKGFGILTSAGLGWMVLAGWYNTPSFGKTQLIQPDPTGLGQYGNLALLLKDALFWFAIFGAVTFWVLVPAIREARSYAADVRERLAEEDDEDDETQAQAS